MRWTAPAPSRWTSARSPPWPTSPRRTSLLVNGARTLFTERPVRVLLDRLADVGLGYVSLGQELDTLWGGERQRLKLAIEMSTDTEVCVLDEPTTGLHMQDVDNLIGLLDPLGQPREGTSALIG